MVTGEAVKGPLVLLTILALGALTCIPCVGPLGAWNWALRRVCAAMAVRTFVAVELARLELVIFSHTGVAGGLSVLGLVGSGLTLLAESLPYWGEVAGLAGLQN
jgi:hypothetical protein